MEITVDTIGAQGDGIAETSGGRLYIPFAAPGDRLRVEPGARRGDGRAARIRAIIEPGPNRIEPVCRHFGTCGGCRYQHIAPDGIAAIKRDTLRAALARRGLDALCIEEPVSVPPGTRRRARLSYRRGKRDVFGFNRRESHAVEDIHECPVTLPEIANLLEPLRSLCSALPALGRSADLQITRVDAGIDLLLATNRRAEPGLPEREELAAFANTHGLCGGVAATASPSSCTRRRQSDLAERPSIPRPTPSCSRAPRASARSCRPCCMASRPRNRRGSPTFMPGAAHSHFRSPRWPRSTPSRATGAWSAR
jgi:23S rRNA (uracil1939-C5)-methyltransferase